MADTRAKMNIEDFMVVAGLHLEAWAAATRHAQMEGDEGFVGEQFENRTLVDWWREVAAYHEYVELQEALANDRRSNGTVERRRPHSPRI